MLPLTIKSWFNLKELSGSLGDLGLFIPLVVAMTIVGKLDLGVILICAGAMNILTGLIFRQPIPVQPMKVIAVVVISEGLLPEEMVAAGMFMGITMLFLSVFIDRINSYIPKVVVRGIQFGVGVKLALKGIASIGSLPLMGWDSMLAAVVITGILLILLFKDIPGLLFVFLFGFALQYLQLRQDFPSLMFNWPDFHLHWPTRVGWLSGLVQGALPQLPLTLLNSVIAVCALSTNYFPGKGIAPKKVAASVGLMNILCVPLGAIPMCHGAGGLAAQYRFGARTGGSVVMLGIFKIIAGVLFGGALLGLLQSYPMSVLGPLLIFAGVELAKSAKDTFANPKELFVVLVTAAFILGVNTWVGFLVGFGIVLLYRFYNRKIKVLLKKYNW